MERLLPNRPVWQIYLLSELTFHGQDEQGNEMRVVSIAVVTLSASLVGCVSAPDPYPIGSMLPGKLISLSDGRTLTTQIELSPASHPVGKMTALDPKSGEAFEGSYTCVMGSKVVEHQQDDGWGGHRNRPVGRGRPMVAPCTAVLVGNKGVVLNIQMTVRAGSPPVGTGSADDNKGKKYTLMF